MKNAVEVREGVSAEDILPIRHRNLREGLPIETARYPEDAHASTVHFSISLKGKIVGCVTLMNEVREGCGLRLRGMAVDSGFRGNGLGAILLTECQRFARGRGAGIWCNARVGALGLYRRGGFVSVGGEFEIEGIGPHFVMEWKNG
ncbi:MAG: GNAT family N-acetyltransferase [Planctomycetota bacterium]|nr:GNAT family N-acetyltransferase [Planctomycetota bacterium]